MNKKKLLVQEMNGWEIIWDILISDIYFKDT